MAVWLDGRLAEGTVARIDPADRGFLLGDGLFETMRASGGRVPLLAQHLARLGAGCALLGMEPPAGSSVAAAVAALLEAEGLGEAAVRLTFTRGPGPRGLLPPASPSPTLLLAAFPLPAPVPPPSAITARSTRRNERSPLAGVKALGYLDAILALREARAAGAEEAILLNTADRPCCASAANLFLVREGRLLTPALSEGAMPGITRGLVLAIAEAAGLAIEERAVAPDRLAASDEAFLTSSLRRITPLRSIDGRPLPHGAPGPVTSHLAAALCAAAAA